MADERTPSAATLYQMAQLVYEHNPNLFEDLYRMAQQTHFVYDEKDESQTYVEQLENVLLQTLDKGKHFVTSRRTLKDKKAVAVPSLDEMKHHFATVTDGARDYNALLRLILSGHEPTVVRGPAIQGAGIFGGAPLQHGTPVIRSVHYYIAHTYNDGVQHQLRITTSHLTTSPKTRVDLLENDNVIHSYSYSSPCSVFNSIVVEPARLSEIIPDRRYDEQSDNVKRACTYLEDVNPLFDIGILSWLAEFYLKGELPMYKEHETGNTATVRTFADLTLPFN